MTQYIDCAPRIFDLDLTAHKALDQTRICEKFAMNYESYGHTEQAEQAREDARRWRAEHDAAVQVFEIVTESAWYEVGDELFGYSLEQRLLAYYRRDRADGLRPMDAGQVAVWIYWQMPSLDVAEPSLTVEDVMR